jgi:hypothetical protein
VTKKPIAHNSGGQCLLQPTAANKADITTKRVKRSAQTEVTMAFMRWGDRQISVMDETCNPFSAIMIATVA